MRKSTRQRRVANAITALAEKVQADEFLALQARDQPGPVWYLFGRVEDGKVLFYPMTHASSLAYPQPTKCRLNSLQIRNRIKNLQEQNTSLAELEACSIKQVEEIGKWIDRFFMEQCGLSDWYELEVRQYHEAGPLMATVADKFRADLTWPTGLRIVLGGIAVWAAIQVGFLAASYAGSVPSSTAELVSTHHDVQYQTSMAFHSLAILLFAAGALLPLRLLVGFRSWIDDQVHAQPGPGWWLLHAFYSLFALGLFIVFLVSISQARYQVFTDVTQENIIRRDTHLLPPGVTYHTIQFNEIDKVSGEIHRHSHSKDDGPDVIEYHSVVSVVTTDGRQLEIGRDFQAQATRRFAPEADSLAQVIADKSGARLELR